MPTRADILAAAETTLATFAAALHAHQAARLAASGKYQQFLTSHAAVPQDGAEAAAPPTHPLRALAGFPALLPMSVEVHEYADGQGRTGYAVILSVRVGGTLWRKAVNRGFDATKEADWHSVAE